MTPDAILSTYDAVADDWDRLRDRTLFERRHLDRMLTHAPGKRVLDLGCGTGRPIAQYLVERRCEVTGVDGAPAMVALFRRNVPGAEAVVADMRRLALGRSFDAILAWDSFFHLSPDDQRAMMPVFAAHAAPRAVLMFTAGPAAGEPVGDFAGHPLYHASLDPEDYRQTLAGRRASR
jgi:SAM-dependent methyltransferase